MPLRCSSTEYQGVSQKALPVNLYEASGNEPQSILPRWAQPVIPTSQSLAQFPRRMAELMCGGCGGDDQPDDYFSLPHAQPEMYESRKPYSTETHSMNGAQVLPETTAFPLIDAKDFSHGIFSEDSVHATSMHATFAQEIQLQTTPELIQDGFIYTHNTIFSSILANQLVKQEQDLLSSPVFGQGTLADIPPFLIVSPGSLIDPLHQGSWANTNMHVQQSNFDILMPNQRGGKRGPFRDPNLREQTAQTRKIGSCIRCRMQRIRCEHNPDEPGGACLTCKKVSNTKAGRFPCLRYKITDIRLFKPGQVPGYEWTRRWNNNISDPIQKWASPDVKFIRISTSFSTKCIELKVRKFVPQEGDKLERTWDFEGRKRSVKIPPYALMDLDDGKSAYMSHIRDAMGDTLQYVAERSCGLLKKTYIQAFRMYQDPSIPEDWRQLFDWTFRLWVAVRLSTTSEFIVGEEKLGMPDNILDSTSSHSGKIPVPPVLGAQLDLVLIHHIQTKLRRELLDKLQKMILKNKQSTWFVTYLVTLMLLHNAALITAHDAAYARKHGIKRRFAREDKVKEYHLGANILLAHFHYCNKGWYPFSEDCKDQDLRTLADLNDDKIRFVHATRKFAREHKREWDKLREQGAWEDDYFFVSQLFEENWHPRSGA
ncbi:hypothetical protein MAC_03004 [Metarhizium acridum CQMa 102]|uniref:Zn(2)-C6 fungal-type domain-containing protein n=1 Tax=Metarhizium acridum (strain CQMa 102) TaxID=655827 RepID=E9DZF6_METAQ|nr:uncharacterized protein MAC_03004 [Metarhizium acridum CQMa 102]EFY90888.1 hypothetical protein MAC_03004 [Metarhizium acridum CQMa 102]